MAQSPELESRFIRWVTGFVIASFILAALTVFASLFEGTVDGAIYLGVATLICAVAARVTAQVVHGHIAAANIALVIALIAFGSALQSALLGTGQ
ncbi:MAG TPA: hypothetical protein VEQ37_03565 [Actinomycetota bacterium]|nr:hypothetical protein [Actinomycetota bacterium]